MKLRWKILLGVIAPIAAAALWLTVAHYRAKNALAAYKQKLIAQGEEFDIDRLTPPPLGPVNGALNLLSLAAQATITNQVPMATMMRSGRARVSWQQEALPTSYTANLWSNLNAELAQKQSSIAAIPNSIPDSSIQFPMNYQQGYGIVPSHLPAVKGIGNFLAAVAIQELHDGKLEESRNHLLAAARLVRRFGDNEPIPLSQLVRVSMARVAMNATWEALQHEDWNPQQLAAIQQEWEAFNFLDSLESSVDMERAFGAEAFSTVRDSSQPAGAYYKMNPAMAGSTSTGLDELAELGKGLAEDPVEGFNAIIKRYPKYWAWKGWWSYEEELFYYETQQASLEAIRAFRKSEALAFAMQELNKREKSILKSHPNAESRFVLGFGTPSIFISKIGEAEVARRMLVIAIALKNFHLKEGRYPNGLQELVPGHVSVLPKDSMNGQPFHYRANDDGSFLLYSVGSDGVDNGGDPAEVNVPYSDSPRRASRPWSVRKDAVWPSPATDQEIKALHDPINAGRSREELQKKVSSSTNADTNAAKALLDRYAPAPLPANTN